MPVMPTPETTPVTDPEETLLRQLPATEKPVDPERDRIEQTLEERAALERDRTKLVAEVTRSYPGEIERINRLVQFARGTLPEDRPMSQAELKWAYDRPLVKALMDTDQNLRQAETILESAKRPNVVGGLFKEEPREPGVIPEGYPEEHLAPIESEETRQ